MNIVRITRREERNERTILRQLAGAMRRWSIRDSDCASGKRTPKGGNFQESYTHGEISPVGESCDGLEFVRRRQSICDDKVREIIAKRKTR